MRLEPAVNGNAAVGIGPGGTIILGIWLAFSVGGYEIWDGWIIAAIVLWLICRRDRRSHRRRLHAGHDQGAEYKRLGRPGRRQSSWPSTARPPNGLLFHLLFLASLAVLLILIVMIFGNRAHDAAPPIRPDAGSSPSFVHVLAAMILVGGLLTGASVLAVLTWRGALAPPGWSLLPVALPVALIPLARIGANWIYARGRLGRSSRRRSPAAHRAPRYLTADTGGLIPLVPLSSAASASTGCGEEGLRPGSGRTLVLAIVLLAHTSSPCGRWPASRLLGTHGRS